MLAVELRPGIPGARRAVLRPLRGEEEALVEDGGHRELLALVERLLVDDGDGTLAGKRAADLPICDMDRLFATLHLHYFGDPVESRARCVRCSEPFEVRFSLSELRHSVEEGDGIDNGASIAGPNEQGVFELADGRRFRLPTVRDMAATSELDPETAARYLRRECVLTGDPERDAASLNQAMEKVGPVLDRELETTCPSCETAQTVRFEIQSYFGRALAFERRYLTHEVHHLARAYGWPRSEILAMTREDRRAHVRLVLGEGTVVRSRPAAARS